MKKRQNWQRGETLLETLIGLVIIGLVMMCLPMAVTATANINSKVAEQTMAVTYEPVNPSDPTASATQKVEATVTVFCDNPSAHSSYSGSTMMFQDGTAGGVDTTVDCYVSGYAERNQFYYYDFTVTK